jgi:type III restriction enzyme
VKWQELDYEEHILPGIDWGSLQLPDTLTASSTAHELQTLAVDLDGVVTANHGPRKLYPDKEVTLAYFTRQIAPYVPNPWYASGMVKNIIQQMTAFGYSDDEIYDRRSDLARKLRESIIAQVEKMAEYIFLDKRDAGVIRFDLEQVECNYPVPQRYRIAVAQRDNSLQKNYGQPLVRNLFEWLRDGDFNTLERECAYCLDDHAAIQWWHRIAERQRHEYYLRGWLPQRIFPDFIAMASEPDTKPQLLVFESKGAHLKGNDDTQYKQSVLTILEDMFNSGKTSVRMGPEKGIFRLVFDKSEIVAALDGMAGA